MSDEKNQKPRKDGRPGRNQSYWRGRPQHARSSGQEADPAAGGERKIEGTKPDQIWIYGIHAVAAVLKNPNRKVLRAVATKNAAARLEEEGSPLPQPFEEVAPRDLDRLLGEDAVHQGVGLHVAPLVPLELDELGDAQLVLALDQVTDPHNVGAIIRSAVAFGADAILTTGRHAPAETGVLAKAASGGLEQIRWVEVPNLARALTELGKLGYSRVGLDSEGTATLETAMTAPKLVLVLGAEGKGIRRLTRDLCDVVARLDMPGPIKSLNVSNAAALSLYVARRYLDSLDK